MIFLTGLACKKDTDIINREMIVQSKKGIVLRTAPSTSSEKIRIIPYNAFVSIKQKSDKRETINDKNDWWYYVEWNNLKGWVFGGFISEPQPENFLITKTSVGSGKIGMSFDEFLSYFSYNKIETTGSWKEDIIYQNEFVILALFDGDMGKSRIIKQIQIYDNKFKTSNGIHTSMPIKELIKIYPKINLMQDEDGRNMFYPNNTDNSFAIELNIEGEKKISTIDQFIDVNGEVNMIRIGNIYE